MNNSDRAAYVSNALYQTRKSGNWSSVLTLRTVRDTIRSGKPVTEVDFQKIKSSYDRAYASRNESSAVKNFDSAVVNIQYDFWTEFGKLGVPGTQNVGDFVRQDLERIHSGSIETQYARNALGLNAQKNDFFVFGNETPAQVVQDILDIAEGNAEVRNAVNAVMGPEWQAQTTDTASQIQNQNPDFNESLKLNQLLSATGELRSDTDAVKALLKEKIESSLGDIRAAQLEATASINSLVEQAAPVGRVSDDITEILSRMKSEAEQKARQEIEEWNDDSLRSIASVAGILIGDKKLAREIDAVVDSYLKIKSLTNQYNSASNAAAGLQTGIGAMGTLGLVCGYIGVAIALYSVLSANDGPSAEEVILDAVKQLSEQLEETRRQIMDGLKVLDKKLSDFIHETADNFEIIRDYLNEIDVDLNNAQDSLRNISIQLNQMWAEVDEKLDFLIDANFRATQSNIYEFKTDNGREMTKDEFVGFLTEIRIYFRASKQEMFTGDPDALNDSTSLHTAIARRNAPESINIIRKYLEEHSGAQFDGDRCNPGRIDMLADLLLTMAVDNPSAFREIPSIQLFKDVYSEMKTDRRERSRLLSSGGDVSLITLFESLLNDYSDSVENLVNTVRNVHREELVRNPRINEKGADSGIIRVLKVYADIQDGFRLEDWNVAVSTFHEHSLDKLSAIPVGHGETATWRDFYADGQGPGDLSTVLPGTIHEYPARRRFDGMTVRGNPEFQRLRLPRKLARLIFEEMPLLSLAVNTEIVSPDFLYYATVYPYSVDRPQIGAAGNTNILLNGRAAIYYRLGFKFGPSVSILARPRLRDFDQECFYAYLPPTGVSLPTLQEVIVHQDRWDTEENYGTPSVHFQGTDSTEGIGEYIYGVVNDYANTVKARILQDLANPASNVVAAIELVETRAKMIKLVCEYLFRHVNNLMTDQLSFIVGDLRKDFVGTDSLTGLLPLLDKKLVTEIVSSYSFPSEDADSSDVSRSSDFVDLQFLDKGLMDKTKETVTMIAMEVEQIVSRISRTPESERYLSASFVGMEMVVASSEYIN